MHALLFDAEKNNGAGAPFRMPLGIRTYSAAIAGSGTLSATVSFQGSSDAANWAELGSLSLSGTDSASGSTIVRSAYTHTRAVISAISGLGAAVTAQVEARSVPTSSPRVVALTDAATITPNADTTDQANLLTVGQDSTIANPTGTPVDGQVLKLRVKSAAAKNLTFGSQYRATATALPTATQGSGKTERWVFEWNAADSKWDVLTVNVGA